MSPSQHVLFIGNVWPEPSSSAAGSRTLQLIHLFQQQGWKISFASAASESEHSADLEATGVTKHTIQLNDSSFDHFIKELAPTIVIFDRFMVEEQFGWRVAEHCPTALRVLDTIDLHCLRIARHAALKQSREFTLQDLSNDTAKREIAAIYRCDLGLMISEVEVELLKEYFKIDSALLHYTPFLPDAISTKDQAEWRSYEERKNFVTIGNFLHEPNWDSVLYLKNTIWPLIRKRLPEAEMHVYGSYPSQKVFQLHNPKENFLIKGRAENVKDVMKTARICLAPLRFGAGMKGKLLDAMLYGTPSVTTTTGAESMYGTLPWNGAIENDAEKFAEAAIRLYTNKEEWKQAQQNGIQLIAQHFSKDVHGKQLVETILNVQAHLEEHRLKNFTGAMLMHHQSTGTKYMALWIEAKNRLKMYDL